MIASKSPLIASYLLFSPVFAGYRVAINPSFQPCKYQGANEILSDTNTPPAAVTCHALSNGVGYPAAMIQVDYADGTLGQTPGETVLAYKDYNCSTTPKVLDAGCWNGASEEPYGWFAIEIKPSEAA
ncbi:hypothetical protein N0V90_009432 [Kalmusia sp. IMI 367209]|nr:hypothetical protein N0V90_009432 [Kalmusia sp. IMI 367209]